MQPILDAEEDSGSSLLGAVVAAAAAAALKAGIGINRQGRNESLRSIASEP
jgi:hypothetical protein